MSFRGNRAHGLSSEAARTRPLGVDPSVGVIFPTPDVRLLFLDTYQRTSNPVNAPNLQLVAGSTEPIRLEFSGALGVARVLGNIDNFSFALWVNGTEGETPLISADNVGGGEIALDPGGAFATLTLTQPQADSLARGTYIAQCNARDASSLDWRASERFHVEVSQGDAPRPV